MIAGILHSVLPVLIKRRWPASFAARIASIALWGIFMVISLNMVPSISKNKADCFILISYLS